VATAGLARRRAAVRRRSGEFIVVGR